jgi:hypothetical protein
MLCYESEKQHVMFLKNTHYIIGQCYPSLKKKKDDVILSLKKK